MNAVLNVRFPQNVGNFLIDRQAVSFSRRTVFRGVIIIMIAPFISRNYKSYNKRNLSGKIVVTKSNPRAVMDKSG